MVHHFKNASFLVSSRFSGEQVQFRMDGFKGVWILLLVFCLVSNGLAMSLASRNLNEDPAAAAYYKPLEKSKIMIMLLAISHYVFVRIRIPWNNVTIAFLARLIKKKPTWSGKETNC